MKSRRLVPRRYQVKKETAQIIAKGHPWIFRDKLSSAADVLEEGQWLQLVNSENSVLGYGVFEKEGLVAIRVLKRGVTPPGTKWIQEQIRKALARRENLRKYTGAFRAIHGENDGLPGIVFDVYGKLGVLQTYSPSMDVLGRYAGAFLHRELSLSTVVWKPPAKRQGKKGDTQRVIFGSLQDTSTNIREGKLSIYVDAGTGQKSGAFLDLRNLRKWLTLQKLKGARVLNLFSYTGTLSLAAEVAGADEIWNVDISKGALETAKKRHSLKKEHHKWIAADVFDWLRDLQPSQKFDVIILDPPQMASLTSQVPQALKTYRRLYLTAAQHLRPGGMLIGCCCTSRIPRSLFEREVKGWLEGRFKFVTSLRPEEDHPIGFPEGDYLKILVFKAISRG
jgi:23S rRNA (cytosine1962-C5)-methyltransferase